MYRLIGLVLALSGSAAFSQVSTPAQSPKLLLAFPPQLAASDGIATLKNQASYKESILKKLLDDASVTPDGGLLLELPNAGVNFRQTTAPGGATLIQAYDTDGLKSLIRAQTAAISSLSERIVALEEKVKFIEKKGK